MIVRLTTGFLLGPTTHEPATLSLETLAKLSSSKAETTDGRMMIPASCENLNLEYGMTGANCQSRRRTSSTLHTKVGMYR